MVCTHAAAVDGGAGAVPADLGGVAVAEGEQRAPVLDRRVHLELCAEHGGVLAAVLARVVLEVAVSE